MTYILLISELLALNTFSAQNIQNFQMDEGKVAWKRREKDQQCKLFHNY